MKSKNTIPSSRHCINFTRARATTFTVIPTVENTTKRSKVSFLQHINLLHQTRSDEYYKGSKDFFLTTHEPFPSYQQWLIAQSGQRLLSYSTSNCCIKPAVMNNTKIRKAPFFRAHLKGPGTSYMWWPFIKHKLIYSFRKCPWWRRR